MAFGFEDITFPEVRTMALSPSSLASIGAQSFGTPRYFQKPEEENNWLSLLQSQKPVPTPGIEAYRSHIRNIPQMAEYSPSKWRRFGAAVAGGLTGLAKGPEQGYNLATDIVESPYKSALGEWSVKEQGLRQAASRETEDQKAQNTYLNNILNFYAKEQQEAGRTGRLEKTLASRENISALTNETRKNIAEAENITTIRVRELANDTLEKIAAARNTTTENVANLTTAASIQRAQIAVQGTIYSADMRYITALAAAENDEPTYNKLLNAAQMDKLQQRFIMSNMQKYSSLFSDDGPIQMRTGAGGAPTGQFILNTENLEDMDPAMRSNYFQFTTDLKDYLNNAEKQLNTPKPQGTRINPPAGFGGSSQFNLPGTTTTSRGTQTPSGIRSPTIPQVKPPGTPKGKEIILPNGQKVYVEQVK